MEYDGHTTKSALFSFRVHRFGASLLYATVGIHCITILFRPLSSPCSFKGLHNRQTFDGTPSRGRTMYFDTLFSLQSFLCIVARAIGAPACFLFVCRICLDACRIGVACFCSSSFACRPAASPSAPRFLRRPRTRHLLVLSSQTRGACRSLVHEPGQRVWTAGFFSYGESQPRSYLTFEWRLCSSVGTYIR